MIVSTKNSNLGGVQMRKQTMSVKEVAEYLCVSKETIYNMVKKKEIPHFKIRSRIFFSIDIIDNWIQEQQTNTVKTG
jgi:excisionase family DNA binding protein